MDRGKGRKKVRSRNDDNEDEIDLTLRLSLASIEEENEEEKDPSIKLHDFLGLGEGNSNDEGFARHGNISTSDWGGSSTYGGGAAGLLVAPLRPIALPTIRCSGKTLSSHDQGFLPSTGFATPCRKRPTDEVGGFCRSCGAKSSPVWRKGPEGPRTLCNKCGLKHSRYMKRDFK